MRNLVTALYLVSAFSLTAATFPPTLNDPPVGVGVWCGNYPAAKAYAEANDLPLIMVWGQNGCNHCEALRDALAGETAWVKGVQAVFLMGEVTKYGLEQYSQNSGAVDFAGGDYYKDPDYVSNMPAVRFYWKDRKAVRFSGRSGTMYWKDDPSQSLAVQFKRSVEKFLSEVVVNASYATFPMGDNPCDRLEAVVGTTAFVDVPLVRTNETAVSAMCSVTFVCGSATKTENVMWSADETMKFVRYEIPAALSVGGKVSLTLKDFDGTVLAERSIWGVGTVENSPKNPYWFGEKTADSLAWGEWTMDLSAVTNKVRAWNAAHAGERAYAMVFVGGSCWCPDCAMAEENFFSKQAFKDWAVANRVVFGVLDIPNDPQPAGAFPSQLRYESYRTSDAYVSLRGSAPTNELQRYQSGAGYLSRHSVPWTGNGGLNATDIAARNAFLMGHDTRHDGLNRPERENKSRTGVPVLILLRDDGTVAARWNRFSDVGPVAYSDGYLRRFEEMMAQIDPQTMEEDDDDRSTTARTISSGDSVAASVSSVDQADVYRITGAAENEVMRFRVSGDDRTLAVSVIDGAGTVLAETNECAAGGFALSAKLGTSVYFLRVAPSVIADGTDFGYTNAASTVCAYSIVTSSGMSGGEIGFTVEVTNVDETCGTVPLTVLRAAGSSGSAAVTVRLVQKTGEAVDERIVWTDTPLSWGDGEMGAKTATLTVKADGLVRHDMRLGFALTDLDGPAEDLRIVAGSMTVNVLDVDFFGKPVYRYVTFTDERKVTGYQPGDTIRLTPVDGEMPEGVGLSVEGGSVTAVGAARDEGGEYAATFKAELVRGGDVVGTQDLTYEYTVVDYDFAGVIPSLSKIRTYGNLPLTEGGAVKGLLTVTVPPDGTLTARFMTDNRSFAYSADAWSAFDKSAGRLTAVLRRTDDRSKTMTVTLDARSGLAVFANPVGGSQIEFVLSADVWPEGAAPWKGQYTVQMPQTNEVDSAARLGGAACMALNMTDEMDVADGVMLYAGMLPNGRAFYGSSVLTTNSAGEALLPFYQVSEMRTSPYSFSGGLKIARNAATNYKVFRWSVSSVWTPVWLVTDGYRRSSEFNVFGGYYDKTEITARFEEDFSGQLDNFAFQANTGSLSSGYYGSGSVMAPVMAEMTATNMPRLVDGGGNPQGVELFFSADTGVISGTLNVPFGGETVAVTYRGIALPGWQGCSACSQAGSYVERPWAVGACAFSDYRKEIGAFRNGCEVKLDKVQ